MSRLATAAGVAAIVAVDQVVKVIVRNQVPTGSIREIVPGVDLTHTRNTGVSFGFLGDAPAWVVGAVSTVALLAVVALLVRTLPGRLGRVVAILIVGGAIGNLIDRIAIGSVTDYLDLPLLPPCNVADVAITFGAIGMAAGLLLGGVPEQPERSETA